LPHDEAYWRDLEARVLADALPVLRSYERGEESWAGWLAGRSSWLLLAAAVVSVALGLSLREAAVPPDLAHALAPEESVGRLIAGPEAPSIEELLARMPTIEEEP
jgi:hypothetical protein